MASLELHCLRDLCDLRAERMMMLAEYFWACLSCIVGWCTSCWKIWRPLLRKKGKKHFFSCLSLLFCHSLYATNLNILRSLLLLPLLLLKNYFISYEMLINLNDITVKFIILQFLVDTWSYYWICPLFGTNVF